MNVLEEKALHFPKRFRKPGGLLVNDLSLTTTSYLLRTVCQVKKTQTTGRYKEGILLFSVLLARPLFLCTPHRGQCFGIATKMMYMSCSHGTNLTRFPIQINPPVHVSTKHLTQEGISTCTSSAEPCQTISIEAYGKEINLSSTCPTPLLLLLNPSSVMVSVKL